MKTEWDSLAAERADVARGSSQYVRRQKCRFCDNVTSSVYGVCWRHPLRHCIYCGESTCHPLQVCADHEDMPEHEVDAVINEIQQEAAEDLT